MSSAPTALTTKSSIRCTRTPISHYGSITNCAIGNTPTTACALTSRSPTSLLWNSSPVGNFIGERQSVTNLLDEYSHFSCVCVRVTLQPYFDTNTSSDDLDRTHIFRRPFCYARHLERYVLFGAPSSRKNSPSGDCIRLPGDQPAAFGKTRARPAQSL